MTITCRRMNSTDAALFQNIAAGVFDAPIDPARLPAYLSQPTHLMVLAFDGDLVVGQCTGVMLYHPDRETELFVDEVGTADAYLRKGIATAMLQCLFVWGRERGCEVAWLGTEPENTAANALYRSMQGVESCFNSYEFKL